MKPGPLQPNPERWQRLHQHLGYTKGHTVIVLLFPSVQHARAACELLGAELREKGSALFTLPELAVPQLTVLLDTLLAVAIPEGTGTVWLPFYAEDTRADAPLRSDALRHALSALNRQRNVLARRIPHPLILAGTFDLQDALQSAAPDLWSVRAGVIEFLPDATPWDYQIQRQGESTENFPSLDDAPDPELALATAAELENKFQHAVQDNLPEAQINGYFTEWLQYLARATRGWLGRQQPDRANDALDLALAGLRREGTPAQEGWDVGSLGSLSSLLTSMGRSTDALPIVQDMLEICERKLGREHPDTLRCVNNLAFLCGEQGDYAKAEALFQRALEAQERTLGREHPDTLLSVNNLAALYNDQHDYGKAEPMLKRALETWGRTLGSEHPDTLLSANNLAELYRSQGDFAKAEPLFVRSLTASERTLGREHPATLGNMSNLAGLYSDQGDYAKAELLFERSLRARERTIGGEHPDTLRSMNNFAAFLHERGRSAEALPLIIRAVEGFERVLGPQHKSTIVSRQWLAAIRKVTEGGGKQ